MLQARFFRTVAFLFLLLAGVFTCPAQEKTASLPVIEIKAGSATIQAEVARSSEEKATGLMRRTRLDDNAGMIFIFDGQTRASFWMKDTSLPLSIAFIDAKGVILEITDMRPFDETAIHSASDRVAFALEMNQHWFALNKIKPGTALTVTGTSWATLLKPKP